MLNIIHLRNREDRYAKLMIELCEQGMSAYKIWDGVVHPQLPFVGIRKAHQQIVRDARDRSLPYVIIAEDDVMFLGAGAYDYFISSMPPVDSFDIYLAGLMLSGEVDENNVVVDGYFTGLTLYVMSSKFYETFLSIRETGNIDALLRGKGKFIVCNPMVVSQHGGYSDNSGKIIKSYDETVKHRNLWKGK